MGLQAGFSPAPMPPPQEPLSSWKQIAAYLGVSARTAQNWEDSRGLPVHRSPGPRGRVWAIPSELDAWKALQDQSTLGEERAPAPGWSWKRRAAAMVLVLGAVGLAIWLWAPDANPAKWRLEGELLVVSDERGRALWEFRPDQGRIFSKFEYAGLLGVGPALIDLDGDGRNEVLLPLTNGQPAANRLICLSSGGKVLWAREPREVAPTAGKQYTGVWHLRAMNAMPRPGDKGNDLFTTWSHVTHFPAVARLLNAKGETLREYWHSGHFNSSRVFDLDDGRGPLIYLTGVANGYKQAVLVVLDPAEFAGASREESANHQILGHPAPVEVARVLMPASRLSQMAMPYSVGFVIMPDPNPIVVQVLQNEPVAMGCQTAVVFYEFAPRLRLQGLDFGDGMNDCYNKLKGKFEQKPGGLAAETEDLKQLRWLTPWQER